MGYGSLYKASSTFSLTKNGLFHSVSFTDDEDYDEDEDPKGKGPKLGPVEYITVCCPYEY